MFDARVFRKYDIRGKAFSAITPLFAYVLGTALAKGFSFCGEKAVIGRDCRLSAKSLYDALAAGLLAGGAVPVLLGECPTPCMHFAAETMGIPRGIMVTASHNPAEYIGFKIRGNEGPLCGQDLRLLTAMMEDECVRLRKEEDERFGRLLRGEDIPSCQNSCTTVPDIRSLYLADAEKRLRAAHPCLGKSAGLSVCVDGGNGVAGSLCAELMARLGAKVTTVNTEPDGHFPAHNPDPTVAENARELCALVAGGGFAAGFGLDGDGDRMAAVDAAGRLVPADIAMQLMADDLAARHPECRGRAVVIDVKCSGDLVDHLDKLGFAPVFCETGHGFMRACMRRNNAVFGGEFAGHFSMTENWYGFDDGTFAAASAYCAMVSGGRRLESYMDAKRSVATPELRFPCTDEEKPLLMQKICEKYRDFPSQTVDGIRVDTDDGWFLVRPSNTGDYLSMRFEAASEEAVERLRAEVGSALAH